MTTEQLTVSIENQEQANEKIPLLLQSPASTRILQIEPMLGPIDLKWCEQCGGFGYDSHDCYNPDQGLIDLVTISGQLGPNAQPMHPDWLHPQLALTGYMKIVFATGYDYIFLQVQ